MSEGIQLTKAFIERFASVLNFTMNSHIFRVKLFPVQRIGGRKEDWSALYRMIRCIADFIEVLQCIAVKRISLIGTDVEHKLVSFWNSIE